MNKYIITLEVNVDVELYDRPETWNWDYLIGFSNPEILSVDEVIEEASDLIHLRPVKRRK